MGDMLNDLWLNGDDRHAEYMTDGEYLSGAAKFDASGHLIIPKRDPEACARLMETIDRVLGVEAVRAKEAA